jgi:adiponectin receptor
MAGAILCLLFSTTYHLFNVYNEKFQTFLSRLDYGGISFLIAGSAFPPVIYGFACNPLPKIFYSTIISTTCLTAFILTLMPGADLPKYRRMRGFLFIFVGLFAGVPVIHTSASNDPNILLYGFYFALGGAIYVTGALIYVARIPERFAPGTFDFIVNV